MATNLDHGKSLLCFLEESVVFISSQKQLQDNHALRKMPKYKSSYCKQQSDIDMGTDQSSRPFVVLVYRLDISTTRYIGIHLICLSLQDKPEKACKLTFRYQYLLMFIYIRCYQIFTFNFNLLPTFYIQ